MAERRRRDASVWFYFFGFFVYFLRLLSFLGFDLFF